MEAFSRDSLSEASQSRGASPQWLKYGLIPLMIALFAGTLVTADPLLGYLYPNRAYYSWLNRIFPYIFATLTLLAFGMVLLIYRARHWLFTHRFRVAVFLLVFSCTIDAANAGQLKPSGIAFLICTFFYAMVTLTERRPFLTPLPITIILLGLAITLVNSVINGLTISILGLYSHFNKIILVVLLTNFITTVRAHHFAVRWVIGAAVFSAIVGLASVAVYYFFGFALTFDTRLEYQFKVTPLGKMLRATAFFTNTQSFAHLLIISVPLILFSAMRRRWKLLALALVIGGDLFTFNTGSWLVMCFIFAAAVFLAYPQRIIHHLSIFGFVAILGWAVGLWEIVYRRFLLVASGDNLNDRLEYLRSGIEALERHPFLGMGLKNMGRLSSTAVHNVYVQVAADLGIFGGMMFLALVIYLIAGMAQLISKSESPASTYYLKGVMLSMIGIAVHFMIEPFYDNYVSWMWMGIVASAIAVGHRRSGAPTADKGRASMPDFEHLVKERRSDHASPD